MGKNQQEVKFGQPQIEKIIDEPNYSVLIKGDRAGIVGFLSNIFRVGDEAFNDIKDGSRSFEHTVSLQDVNVRIIPTTDGNGVIVKLHPMYMTEISAHHNKHKRTRLEAYAKAHFDQLKKALQ